MTALYPCRLSPSAAERIRCGAPLVAIVVAYDRDGTPFASEVYPFTNAVETHNGPIARNVDIGPDGVQLPDGVTL